MTGSYVARLSDMEPVEDLAVGGNSRLRLCTFEGKVFVYKEYEEAHAESADFDALHALIAWEHELPLRDRLSLASFCLWPKYLVVDDRAPTGVLMRKAPSTMFERIGTDIDQRHLDALGRDAFAAENYGYPFYQPPERLAVLGLSLIHI